MKEKQRCYHLLTLLQDLIYQEKWDQIRLIGTLVANDTVTIQLAYQIITENYLTEKV